MSNLQVSIEKSRHKAALKNRSKYLKDRDNIIRAILSCYTPNWGSLKVIVTTIK